jgi:hypothetical protein
LYGKNNSYGLPFASFICRNASVSKIARTLRAQGIDSKTANKRAEHEAEQEINVWHCRDCAKRGCGCCASGDISFNEVGGGNWAIKAQKPQE